MSRDLFGTDGVRGLAGTYPLDDAGVRAIGRAVGTLFAQAGDQVLIACDTRESSQTIVDGLVESLNAVGVEVVLAGVLSTPGLAYCTKAHDAFVAGIMVTASHNPYQYNGIKVFDSNGDKLSDETETKLNKLIKEDIPDRQPCSSRRHEDVVSSYEDFLVKSAAGLDLRGMNIAVDTANGAASGLAARVLDRLGAHVIALFDTPNGRNINEGCGATNTKALIDRVVSDKLSLGIALDGDADRVMLVDKLGREVKGDYILYILAVTGHQKGVVATVMSNLGFEFALKRQGIMLERTDVGDRYVLEGLKRSGYKLGGEQSGHIILPDLLATGDGLLAAVQTLLALSNSDKDLAQWCNEVALLPQALVSIPLSDKSLLKTPAVTSFIAAKTQALAGKGRLIIRPSGTEPIARVMVEADDARKVAEAIAAELGKVLAEQTSGTVPFPHGYANELAALPIGQMSEDGVQAVELLKTKGYVVQAGLTPEYADAIHAMAGESSIREYCPKDLSERFSDREATAKWLSKNRATYLLLQEDDSGKRQLAGYGWVGAKESSQVPGGETTFSLRVGENHQGKGLAAPFSVAMLAAAHASYGTSHLWLETWASNGGAVHIYHKLGFKDIGRKDEQRPSNSGQSVADTRIYMIMLDGGGYGDDGSAASS